jgi:hypothetical protein
MATALPGRSYTGHRNKRFDEILVLTAEGVRLLRQGCDALAKALDVSLTAAFLAAGLALAASLVATAAGLTLPRPH